MLEGITAELTEYHDSVIASKKTLQDDLTQIRLNFLGADLDEQCKEAQKTFNDAIQDSRDSHFRKCCGILQEAQETLSMDEPDKVFRYIEKNLHSCFYADSVDSYHFRTWMEGTQVRNLEKIETDKGL